MAKPIKKQIKRGKGYVLWKNSPGYQKYMSLEAMDLAEWSLRVPERKKALKMKRIADKMEDKKRESSNTSYPLYYDLRYF